jgi:hypothetical protein
LGSEPAEEYRRLRGRVDVDSVPGEGSTFRIVFPGVPARSAKPGTTTNALEETCCPRDSVFRDRVGLPPDAASEHKLLGPNLLVLRYNIAVSKVDKDQMERAVGLARGKRGAEHWMAQEEALALARSGRLQAARLSSSRAVDILLEEGEGARAYTVIEYLTR